LLSAIEDSEGQVVTIMGEALIGRDLPGDRERAEQVYHQSLEMFTEMGATGYIQVLEERLGEI
jgi:hypothetical protein